MNGNGISKGTGSRLALVIAFGLWAATTDGDGLDSSAPRRLTAGETHVYTFPLEAHEYLDGQRRLALPLYEEMLRHARAAADRVAEAWGWTRLAGVYRSLGETGDALVTARAALVLWQQIGHRGMEAHTYALIGSIYTQLAETQKALDYFHLALQRGDEAENPRWRANTLEELTTLHVSMAAYGQAIATVEQALRIYQSEGLLDRQVAVLGRIGWLHATQGRPEEALRLYQEVLALSEASERFESTTCVLLKMALLQASLGRSQEAKRLTRRAKESLREWDQGVYRASYLHFLPAKVDARLGEAEAALSGFRAALGLYKELDESRLMAATLYEIARLEADQGRLQEALKAVEEAVQRIESQREVVGGHRLQALFLASRREAYKLWIDVLMRLAASQPSAGYAARAFEVHERSLARNLLEAISETRPGIRRGLDPALSERQRQLTERLRQYMLEEIRKRASDTRAPAMQAAELTDLLAEYGELQDRSRAGSRPASERIPVSTLTLAEVREQVLDEETVLLEYALGDPRSFLWVVTSSSASTFELPGRADIEALAWRAYGHLTARAQPLPFTVETASARRRRIEQADDDYRAAAVELSQMLLTPTIRLADGGLGSLLEARRIVVIGEGVLQYLPFSALPIPGTPGAPLGFEYEVVTAPSASVLGALRRRDVVRTATRKGPRKTLAVLADPALRAEDKRFPHPFRGLPLQRSLWTLGFSDLPALPGARREAKSLERLVPRRQRLVALGGAASREMVLSGALAPYRLVHFATHTLLNSRHPDLSGMVLSLVDEQGRPQDGFLRLDDIYDLQLSADLVVLSACQTALGEEIRGEGLVGLTHAFMYAGVPTVVGSLWSPDDDATAALMARFYDAMLRQGLPPATALRQAQAAIAAQPQWRSPYYWAAFVLQGDWRSVEF
jgi:CHAT domain-containing protein